MRPSSKGTLLVFSALLLAACGSGTPKGEAAPQPSAAPSAEPSAAPSAAASADPAASDDAAEKPDAQDQGAGDSAEGDKPPKRPDVKLPAFTWTKTPKLGPEAPKDGVVGSLGGMAVRFTEGKIDRSRGEWSIELGEPRDYGSYQQSVTLHLPSPPKVGQLSKPYKYGEGYLQILDKDHTTSLNADNAWVVEFTKWDVKPYSEDLKYKQAGTASGRIVVVYEGFSAETKPSWVLGTFKDLPVSYHDAATTPPPKKK